MCKYHALDMLSEMSGFLLQLKLKGDLNIGFVALDAVVQRTLHISNSGLNNTKFRVEIEPGLPAQVIPVEGKLTPNNTAGSTCELKLELTADVTGPLAGKVSIFAEDQTEPVQPQSLPAPMRSWTSRAPT